jgi:hypothetical protein
MGAAGIFSACSKAKSRSFAAWTSPAPTTPRTSTDRPQRPAAQHEQGLCKARWWWCSLATPSAPTCAPPPCRSWPRSSSCWARRRQAAGHLRHRGPRARHARGAQGLHGQFRPQLPGPASARPSRLAAVAKDFKIYYKKVDGKTPTSYTMDHSAGSYVYDTQGRLRLYTATAAAHRPWRPTSSARVGLDAVGQTFGGRPFTCQPC